jgi:hypothetical protein
VTHDGSTQTRPLADDAARGMPRLPWWAAILALETGLLHMIAGSDHVRAWWGYGVFFLVVALCRIIGGTALLVKSSRGLYLTGHIVRAAPCTICAVTIGAGLVMDQGMSFIVTQAGHGLILCDRTW